MNNQPIDVHVETELSPQIADLRIRLAHVNSTKFTETRELANELNSIGKSCLPLVPLILEKLKTGHLRLASSQLIDLYRTSRHPQLLEFILRNNHESPLGMSEKIALLECGCTDLEAELLRILFASWKVFGDIYRKPIVEVLGKAGTRQSLEFLQIHVLPRLAERVNEGLAKHEMTSQEVLEDADVIRGFEVAADQQLLEAVRTAITELTRRAYELPPTVSEHLPAESSPRAGVPYTADPATTELVVEEETFSVRCGNKRCELRNTNLFRIIKFLIDRRGKSVSHEELVHVVWDQNKDVGAGVEPNTIHRTVSNLRKKLKNAGIEIKIDGKTNQGYYRLAKD